LEEEILIKDEMGWTIRYFMWEAEGWETRVKSAAIAGLEGHRCYGAQKVNMWRKFAELGIKEFRKVGVII